MFGAENILERDREAHPYPSTSIPLYMLEKSEGCQRSNGEKSEILQEF